MKQEIKLENRASTGIRAYTETISYNGSELVIEITVHHPWGRYVIIPYWKTHGNDEIKTELNQELRQKICVKFKEAKSFVEEKFNIELILDRKNSNDNKTWEENINETDKILPFESKFWSLPEHVRTMIRSEESIIEFLKRIHEI